MSQFLEETKQYLLNLARNEGLTKEELQLRPNLCPSCGLVGSILSRMPASLFPAAKVQQSAPAPQSSAPKHESRLAEIQSKPDTVADTIAVAPPPVAENLSKPGELSTHERSAQTLVALEEQREKELAEAKRIQEELRLQAEKEQKEKEIQAKKLEEEKIAKEAEAKHQEEFLLHAEKEQKEKEAQAKKLEEERIAKEAEAKHQEELLLHAEKKQKEKEAQVKKLEEEKLSKDEAPKKVEVHLPNITHNDTLIHKLITLAHNETASKNASHTKLNHTLSSENHMQVDHHKWCPSPELPVYDEHFYNHKYNTTQPTCIQIKDCVGKIDQLGECKHDN